MEYDKNGVLNIKKPAGMTSFTCANIVRRVIGASKAGHAGTLDPNAEGVLPVCVNKCTKCTELFLDMGKSYIGKIKFGSSTDTMDAWGTVLETADTKDVTEEKLLGVLEEFKGEIQQLPPQYSAVKKDGVPLYKLARKGIFTEIQPRNITIYELKLLSFSGDEAEIYVHCSKGTYIRVLINDIGEKMGCHAHMSALTRMSYGPLKLENSVTLEELRKAAEEGRICEKITGICELIPDVQKIELDDDEYKNFRDGKNVLISYERTDCSEKIRKDICCLFNGGELTAISHTQETEGGYLLLPWKFFGKTEGN